MRDMAERLSLPLRHGIRRTTGSVQASGSGNSMDFQDHRPYVPGDDPRHIDWQAYARSEHYTMKLYREEVRPIADLVLDCSASMFLDEEKTTRTLELAWFCAESAARSRTAVRLFSLNGSQLAAHSPDEGWELFSTEQSPDAQPAFHRVPWRPGSLRVIVSDLLFPAEPHHVISSILPAGGRAILLAPFSASESDPDWLGNTELLDSETSARRDLHFQRADMQSYLHAYREHFDLWQREARRHNVCLARVPSGGTFLDAMNFEALSAGAVELRQ